MKKSAYIIAVGLLALTGLTSLATKQYGPKEAQKISKSESITRDSLNRAFCRLESSKEELEKVYHQDYDSNSRLQLADILKQQARIYRTFSENPSLLPEGLDVLDSSEMERAKLIELLNKIEDKESNTRLYELTLNPKETLVWAQFIYDPNKKFDSDVRIIEALVDLYHTTNDKTYVDQIDISLEQLKKEASTKREEEKAADYLRIWR
ncbi:MAG TPA: hypothetical protein VJJ23_00420, partial [Candidatus Nanoarchaeia archaeon]|nr:hypothetical protein [Candidatus Nanoarchaeia archaeon]